MVEFVDAILSRESTCALPILSLVSGSEKRERERPKFHPVSPQSVCNSSNFFVAITFTSSDLTCGSQIL
jgi:hypothetical protein